MWTVFHYPYPLTSLTFSNPKHQPPTMASLLSLSSAPPSTANYNYYTSSLHYPSSNFKGNTHNLRETSFNFTCLKLQLKSIIKERRPLVVAAASSTLESTSGSVSGSGSETRFRLYNLGPQPGSRKKGKRKGRGHAAGQGGSCGFGMRGQKSRSGPGVMKGFEGGQMPLYRRIPKLRGIAGVVM
ncbi:50S ribosomal protein L15 chloroplastic [Bienertia sinuspersici]